MLNVVFLHSVAPILHKIGEIDFSYWMTGNIYDSTARVAVPLFFMVSGVLLLNSKEESLTIFFKKRFLKVVIPLIAWSLIYIIFRKYELHQDINIFKQFIYSFNGKVYYHLWFLYTILGIYLFLPILKVFIKNSSQSLQIYFLVLWAISVSLIPLINTFSGLYIKSYMPMMAGYMGYLVLGYQLGKIKITKKIFYIGLFFMIISTCITIFGTYYFSEKADKFISFSYNYLGISILIQAISSFIFLKYIGENIFNLSIKILRLITILSISSFGIYLIHPLYIHILSQIGISVLNGNPMLMIPIVTILTFILSFVTIFIMQKIPLVKQIVP